MFSFSEENQLELQRISSRYPDKRSALLPSLYLAQRQEGYISHEAIIFLSRQLDLSPMDIWGVVSFYTMFRTKPVGRYHIQVCTNLSCGILGSEDLVRHTEHKLGIKAGETTRDGLFSLSTVECLGFCGNAPAMQVNEKYYGDMTEEKVDELLEELRPAPAKKPAPKAEAGAPEGEPQEEG